MKLHEKLVESSSKITNLIQRFNPFYFPKDSWKEKKYITLNHFKGYQCFDLHYWSPQKRSFSDSWVGRSEKLIMMVGVTLFYLRVEVFFEWGHQGVTWKH